MPQEFWPVILVFAERPISNEDRSVTVPSIRDHWIVGYEGDPGAPIDPAEQSPPIYLVIGLRTTRKDGPVTLRIELDMPNDRVEIPAKATISNGATSLLAQIVPVNVHVPGRYTARVFADGVLVGDTTLVVEHFSMSTKGLH